MKILKFSSLLVLCAFVAVSCGDNKAGESTEEVIAEDGVFPKDIVNTIDSLGRANLSASQQSLQAYMQETNQNLQLKTVLPAETLLKLYPKQVLDLSVFDKGGEISDILGSSSTLTRVIYRNGNVIARVNLVDTGGHPGAILASAHWAPRAIDREEENVMEHTRTFRGFPAFTRWQPRTMQSTFEYVIDNRFVVAIQGKNMDMAKVEEVAKFLSPAQLRQAAK